MPCLAGRICSLAWLRTASPAGRLVRRDPSSVGTPQAPIALRRSDLCCVLLWCGFVWTSSESTAGIAGACMSGSARLVAESVSVAEFCGDERAPGGVARRGARVVVARIPSGSEWGIRFRTSSWWCPWWGAGVSSRWLVSVAIDLWQVGVALGFWCAKYGGEPWTSIFDLQVDGVLDQLQ